MPVMAGRLYLHLRRRHKRHRSRTVGRTRGAIRNRVGIEHRPAGARNRSRYGHWEGDTVEGKKGTGGIVTYVERKSRYLISIQALRQDGIAHERAHDRSAGEMPARLRRTMTVDNGKAFATFERTDQALTMQTYFANPHAPWERGTNENTNGLIRQYYPQAS